MSISHTMYAPSEIERLTGIPMNTLRAWERRYGVPKPQRGSGGHRMYSETDLQMLQFLRKQVAAGVSISHAIANFRAQQPAHPHMHPEALVKELLDACQAFDERRAEKILSDAFAFHTIERVCAHVLTPVLHDIGRCWAQGTCSVATEHFTTSVIKAQLYAVLRTLPPPQHRPLFFVACAPGEQHAIAPLMLTLLLRRAGYRALFFGADLPLDDIVRIVPELRPDLLVLSVSMPQTLGTLQSQIQQMRRSGISIPIVLGGQAFAGAEDMPSKLKCQFLGNDMLTAINKLDDALLRMGLMGRAR